MLSKVNSFGLLTVMAIALLLFVCFTTSAVYADGGAGQSPEPPPETIDGAGGQVPDPPPLNSPGDGSGGDGGTTLMDVVETVLGFII
jgi:hypothetical protein